MAQYIIAILNIQSLHIQLWLHDTAGMEKKGGVVSMTKSYFRQAVGIILVYDTKNLESLYKIKDWVKVAEDTCEYAENLVYALWGNEKGSLFSSVDNPVENYHLDDLLDQLRVTLAKPVQIEGQLVCQLNGIDQTAVANNYETLVRTIHSNVKRKDTVMKEVSQKIALAPNLEVNPGDDPNNTQKPPRRSCFNCF